MPWDSPLAGLAELVSACGDFVGDERDLHVSELVVETPLELSVTATAEGEVVLAGAPPRQAAETTVMPVLHRIRLRVEVA